MRIFLAGASGVIGRRLIPLLVEAGHAVAGMTRSVSNVDLLAGLGAEAVVCDVFDLDGLTAAVIDFAPELVIHQLTDLPDDLARIGEFGAANARIRREGTRNLLTAAASTGAGQLIAQSVAWALPGDAGVAVADMERMVLAARRRRAQVRPVLRTGHVQHRRRCPPTLASRSTAPHSALSQRSAPRQGS